MFRMSCPSCGKELKSSAPIAPGKKVRCPGCRTVFSPAATKTRPAPNPVADEDDDDAPRPSKGIKKPTAPPPPARGGAGIQKKKPTPPAAPPPAPFGGFEDEEDDGPPPPPRKKGVPALPKGKSKAKPPVEEDEDDFDDDEEEDDRPRGKKASGKKSSLSFILILSGAAVALIGLFLVGAFVWPGFLNSSDLGPIRPKGGPGIPPGPVAKVVEPLSYIPADSFGVVGANLQGLRANPLTAPLAVQGLKKMGASVETDKVAASIDTLHFGLWGEPDKGDGVMILQASAPLDAEQVKQSFKAKDVPGKDYFQVEEQGGFLAQPDPKFLVLCPNKNADAAEKVLGAGGPELVLPADLQEQIQQNKDALLYFAMSNQPASKEQIRQMRAMAGPKSPFPDRFWTILENARAGNLTLRPDGDGLKIQIGVTCDQDAAAPELTKMVQSAWDTQVKPLLALAPLMLAQKKGAPTLTSTLQDLSKTFRVETFGPQAVASIRFSPAAMNELAKGLSTYINGPKLDGPR